MRRKLYRLAMLAPLLVVPPLLSGCVATMVAGAAVAVVKAPFQIAGVAVDTLTTSQEEADRNAGKKARKEREATEKDREAAEKARKKAEKAARKAEREAEDD